MLGSQIILTLVTNVDGVPNFIKPYHIRHAVESHAQLERFFWGKTIIGHVPPKKETMPWSVEANVHLLRPFPTI